MNTSPLRIILFALSLALGAGWSAAKSASECLNATSESGSMLSSRETLGVVIDLPPDAKGPIVSTDSGDYLWQISEGDIRVLFHSDPTGWPGVERLKSGTGQSVQFFRWKDYAKKDLLLGYQPRSSSQDRSVTVQVPVDWNSCSSIGRAAQIVRSTRLINDPSKLRILSVEQKDSGFVATMVNEVGEKKTVHEGEVVTRDSGRIKSISKNQVLVEEYVWGSGWRTVALKFEK